jgi:integrase
MNETKRKPFYLENRNGIYSVIFNDSDGHKLTARSTGKRTIKEAQLLSYSWLKEYGGPPPKKVKTEKKTFRRQLVNLIKSFNPDKSLDKLPDESIVNTVRSLLKGEDQDKENPMLVSYLLEFWDESKSFYIKDLKAVGRASSNSTYYKCNLNFIKRYAVDYFEGVRIKDVSCEVLEKFRVHLAESISSRTKKKLSSKTVHTIMQSISIALNEAERQSLIVKNPARKMRKHKSVIAEREILTSEEVEKLFEIQWSDERSLLASKLAAAYGLRAGEIGALRIEDINEEDSLIWIKHSWDRSGKKLKCPKNGKMRKVFAHPILINLLLDQYENNPHKDGFIFWSSESPNCPMNMDLFLDHLKKALKVIGIDQDEYKRRNLSFHSWRHFNNAMLRGSIDNEVLRSMIGHSSEEMTNHYDHMTPEKAVTYRKAVDTKMMPLLNLVPKIRENQKSA